MDTQFVNNGSGTRGAAFLELAIILPFLVLMAFGVFDYSRAIHAKNIITNMSREGANLAARSSIAKTDIMNAIAYTGQPLDMNTNGMIYITVVRGNQEGGSVVPRIESQYGWKGKTTPPSKIGSSVGGVANNLSSLNLSSGEIANVVEVFYRYRSVFFNNLGLDKQIYSMSVF
jgi:hypothetical protein